MNIPPLSYKFSIERYDYSHNSWAGFRYVPVSSHLSITAYGIILVQGYKELYLYSKPYAITYQYLTGELRNVKDST
jgi:hypothetical protein